MNEHNRTVVWLRQDLRIEDHPALVEASKRGVVIPLYIWDPEDNSDWPMGAASRWWLHHSLKSLEADFKAIGLKLIIRIGKPLEVIEEILSEAGATALFWSRCYEPHSIVSAASVMAHFKAKGVDVKSFNASLLYEPWTIANKQGKPYQVFTPFWKACLAAQQPPQPLEAPSHLTKPPVNLPSATIDSLGLLPKIHWDSGISKMWSPGAQSAKRQLEAFANGKIIEYEEARDYPAVNGVSKISPHLHFGEISPRMIWHAICRKYAQDASCAVYLRQLGWREFAHHLLYHYPKTPLTPLKSDFLGFRWNQDPPKLKAWQKGATGYPFVDAGMRELWATGWMHNRVRMVVGSFLVKDLGITWVEGAHWFWDTLVDADLANNTLGWQWVAGCGADAAPYFRIFNPMTQGEKFDGNGDYIRRWVPELARLPNRWIHRPWEAPTDILAAAGVDLGITYPFPIVDHAKARAEALTRGSVQNRSHSP